VLRGVTWVVVLGWGDLTPSGLTVRGKSLVLSFWNGRVFSPGEEVTEEEEALGVREALFGPRSRSFSRAASFARLNSSGSCAKKEDSTAVASASSFFARSFSGENAESQEGEPREELDLVGGKEKERVEDEDTQEAEDEGEHDVVVAASESSEEELAGAEAARSSITGGFVTEVAVLLAVVVVPLAVVFAPPASVLVAA